MRCWADKGVEHAFFGGFFSFSANFLALGFFDQRDTNFDKIADDALDIAADIANLGEFSSFNLEKRRAREFRQTPRDFGFADAGGPNHQNVFRQDFLAQLAGQLLAAPSVAQSYCHGALSVVLADDIAVKF